MIILLLCSKNNRSWLVNFFTAYLSQCDTALNHLYDVSKAIDIFMFSRKTEGTLTWPRYTFTKFALAFLVTCYFHTIFSPNCDITRCVIDAVLQCLKLTSRSQCEDAVPTELSTHSTQACRARTLSQDKSPRKCNFLLTRGNFRQRVANRTGGNRLTTPQVALGSSVARCRHPAKVTEA